MKRQRGRNRGSGGNGGKPQHNTNRAFDSNGPDGVKVRGAAQNVYEKYQQLARDAHTSGDRVLAENYLQHAEHYFRVMRAMQPQRPISEIIGRDQFVSGYDIDFEDESGQMESGEGDATETGATDAPEQQERFESRRDERSRDDQRSRDDYRQRDEYRPREDSRGSDARGRDDRPRDDRARDERPRDDRARDERPRDERPRDERPRDERPRDERPRDDRARDDRAKEDRPRDDRPRDDRQQGERGSGDRGQGDKVQGDRSSRTYRDDRSRYGRDERPRGDQQDRLAADAMAVVEPEATPLPASRTTTMLRADDGETSHAPAFLQVRPAEPREEVAPAVRKAPRRRTPRVFENTEIADAEPIPAAPASDEG